MRTVNLLSGGMDSYVATKIKDINTNLHINFNENYSQKQYEIVCNLPGIKNLQVINGLDLSKFIDKDGSYLPNRNALFVTLAALYGNRIILSATLGDVHPDKSSTFAEMMSALLTEINGYEISVIRPFGDMTKYEVVGKYLEYGNNMEDLYETTSCYDPKKKECLTCRPCLRRLAAFAYHGYRKDEFIDKMSIVTDMIRRDQWSSSIKERHQTIAFLRRLGYEYCQDFLGVLDPT